MNKQAIIEKIRALMAKANDNGATEAESIAFMAKALELLAKHNLEEKDLKEEEIIWTIEETKYKMNADLSWFSRLAVSVAKMYFCKLICRSGPEEVYTSRTHYYCFVGKEHNRMMAVSMFDYLMKTMHRLARLNSDNVKMQYEFKKGCATRLGVRIFHINHENNKPVEGGGGLPALYNTELALVDQYMSGMNLSKPRNTKLTANSSAFYDGMKAGDGISLNKQVNASKGSTLLLK